jgi:hypothetical protein
LGRSEVNMQSGNKTKILYFQLKWWKKNYLIL